MDPVRRSSDDELCGFVEEGADGWRALTVFGAVLGRHAGRDDAVDQVLEVGLPSLTERWTLRHRASGDEEVVCITEANADGVTVALGYYSLPGVPKQAITAEQLARGEWELRRD